MISYLGCFTFLSNLANIIIDIVIAIAICVCIVIMCKYEGSRKFLFYAIGVFIMCAGVFSGISLYQEINSSSYENGNIDIENQFIQKSFNYSESSLTFYHDVYDETETYSYEKILLKVEGFNGIEKNYQMKLNDTILINTEVSAGAIKSKFTMAFKSTDGQVLKSADLEINIKFLSDKSVIKIHTTGVENSKYFEKYFKDNGIRIKVDEFKEEIKYHTVTFKDGENVIGKQTYLKGSKVVFPQIKKDKFVFEGWDKNVEIVNSDLEFQAKFTRLYTIEFLDEEGNLISVQECKNGEKAKVPELPEKEGYTLLGWPPAAYSPAFADATYEAGYLKLIKIDFYDSITDELLSREYYHYYELIKIPEPPEHEGYDFVGYDKPVFVNVEGDAEYRLVYKEMVTLRFLNHDGEVLKEIRAEKGKPVSEYVPSIPNFGDAYRFLGWDKSIEGNVETDAEYKILVQKTFSIYFEYRGSGYGNEILSGTIKEKTNYDEGIETFVPEIPVFEGWRFDSWNHEIDKYVSSDSLYIAKYVKTIKVKFLKGYIDYSEEIVIDQLSCVTADMAPKWIREGYKFIWFAPAFETLIKDTEYVAQWVQLFNISFVDSDGNKNRKTYELNEQISVPKNPIKNGYRFKGWDPEISERAMADIDYAPIFAEIFSVKFISDGIELSNKLYEIGEKVETPNIPLKEGYTFRKWNKHVSATCEGSVEYIAIFEEDLGDFSEEFYSTLNSYSIENAGTATITKVNGVILPKYESDPIVIDCLLDNVYQGKVYNVNWLINFQTQSWNDGFTDDINTLYKNYINQLINVANAKDTMGVLNDLILNNNFCILRTYASATTAIPLEKQILVNGLSVYFNELIDDDIVLLSNMGGVLSFVKNDEFFSYSFSFSGISGINKNTINEGRLLAALLKGEKSFINELTIQVNIENVTLLFEKSSGSNKYYKF